MCSRIGRYHNYGCSCIFNVLSIYNHRPGAHSAIYPCTITSRSFLLVNSNVSFLCLREFLYMVGGIREVKDVVRRKFLYLVNRGRRKTKSGGGQIPPQPFSNCCIACFPFKPYPLSHKQGQSVHRCIPTFSTSLLLDS